MSSCCRGLETEFDRRVAERERRRLERKGPIETSRVLADDLVALGVEGALVLDVGGGLGVVHERLLAAGAERAVQVDGSPAFTAAARDRAEERGYADRVEYHVGDFVASAPAYPRADVVALDRVICCYPDLDAMLDASTGRAGRLLGAVYPRDHWYIRAVVAVQNLFRRLSGNDFRMIVFPVPHVSAGLEARGFRRASRRRTFVWLVEVWVRKE